MFAFLNPSILWAIGGTLVALLIPFGTWALHTPSKVTLATKAAEQHCRADELRTANASLAASLVAEQKASQSLRNRISERSKEEQELSARVEKLKAENDALKVPRTDDSAVPLDPNDPWLLRSVKARAANDPRAKAR